MYCEWAWKERREKPLFEEEKWSDVEINEIIRKLKQWTKGLKEKSEYFHEKLVFKGKSITESGIMTA